METVKLLGTAFTMEQDFYKGRLAEKYDLNVLVPKEEDRKIVHNVIYQELCSGSINKNSKDEYLRIIKNFLRMVLKLLYWGAQR